VDGQSYPAKPKSTEPDIWKMLKKNKGKERKKPEESKKS
jgi:hypothetical protein